MKVHQLIRGVRQQYHISWHITAVAAGILIGAGISPAVPLGLFDRPEWLALATSLLVITFVKRTAFLLIVAGLAGSLFGLWLGSGQQIALADYQPYYGTEVTVTGRIADDTTYDSSGNLSFRLDDIVIGQEELPGEIWLNTFTEIHLKRGDTVTVTGQLDEGFGNLSGSIFRATLIETERPEPGDIGRRARDWFSQRVHAAIPEPEATLGVSYLTGQRRALPDDISERLRILGLTHIVVASGFHLTIIVRAARKMFAPLSKYLAAFSSFFMIGGFLLVTGFSTSMTRAALVAGLSLLAWYYGRNIHPVVLLLAVAALTVVFDPASLWGDMGWLLSFAAFAGVIILAPLLNSYFFGSDSEPGHIRHILLATSAAQITTFPIVASAFGHYSPLALLSNLLMLPFVPIAMLTTAAAGIVAAISESLAALVGLPAYAVLLYMTRLTGWLAESPWAAGEIELGTWHVIIAYVAILALMLYLRIVTGHRLKSDNAVV